MGSLSASGIPVVTKTNYTFRNRGGRQIVRSDSRTDVETTVVSAPPIRMDGSGSIVRDDNTVSQVQEIVTGTYMAGRTVNARISTPAATRSLDVELGDNKTDAVIPSGLDGHTAQIGVKHAGAKLIRENSVTDVVVRVSDSGAYSPR